MKKWLRAMCLVMVLVLFTVFALGSGSDETASGSKGSTTSAETKPVEYTTVEIDMLLDELSKNAYNAQQKWKDQYVAIEGGIISTIDASGEYFAIESTDDQYFLESISVDIPKNIRSEVMSSISSGASVTVKGKITDVGEIMGYSVDADDVIIH